MTENYLIMIEQPWVANSLKLAASRVKGATFYDCLQWCPGSKNVFHVVQKKSGKVVNKDFKYVSSEDFFFLNFINCYEAGNDVIIDLISYASPAVLEEMSLQKLRQGRFENKDKSRIQRFKLPLKIEAETESREFWSLQKKVVTLTPREVITETGCEHPSINRNLTGKKYKFCYVIGWLESVNRGHFANSLTKVDMETGLSLAWRGNEFCHPAEAVFVPKSGQAAEDDGLVVASVTDVREDQRDFLLFLDARSMTELARVNFDMSLPFGSHAYLSTTNQYPPK